MSAPFLETPRAALLKSHTRVSGEDPANHMGPGGVSWSWGPDGLGGFQCVTLLGGRTAFFHINLILQETGIKMICCVVKMEESH